VTHHGALLIEAPTGAGKTLIAGHLAEGFSEGERVIWFWFAPFKGRDRADGFLAARRTARSVSGELSEDRKPGTVARATWGDDVADGGDSREGPPERP